MTRAFLPRMTQITTDNLRLCKEMLKSISLSPCGEFSTFIQLSISMSEKLFLAVLCMTATFSCKKQEYTIIIRAATVYDGSGKPGFVSDVAINADTIAAIGNLSNAVAKQEIHANGLALSPGFIDAHSHHDRGMFDMRDMPACVSQGITTVVVGQDGGSGWRHRIGQQRKNLTAGRPLLILVTVAVRSSGRISPDSSG